MRVKNKGGKTPRDRRLDRRKVAVVACAALLLFATVAPAAPVQFEINTALSSFGMIQRFNDPSIGVPLSATAVGSPLYNPADLIDLSLPIPAAVMAANAAMNTGVWGGVRAEIIDGVSIQLLPGSTQINYLNQGLALPAIMPNGLINTDIGAAPQPAQFAFELGVIASGGGAGGALGAAAIRFASQNFGSVELFGEAPSVVDGGLPAPFVGDSHLYASVPSGGAPLPGAPLDFGTALLMNEGREDILVPGLLDATLELFDAGAFSTGFPTPITGNILTWDGTTLTIDLAFFVPGVIPGDTSHDDILFAVDTIGTLVLTPVVPEPSSMLLMGFGAIGLVTCALRARKRRA